MEEINLEDDDGPPIRLVGKTVKLRNVEKKKDRHWEEYPFALSRMAAFIWLLLSEVSLIPWSMGTNRNIRPGAEASQPSVYHLIHNEFILCSVQYLIDALVRTIRSEILWCPEGIGHQEFSPEVASQNPVLVQETINKPAVGLSRTRSPDAPGEDIPMFLSKGLCKLLIAQHDFAHRQILLRIGTKRPPCVVSSRVAN